MSILASLTLSFSNAFNKLWIVDEVAGVLPREDGNKPRYDNLVPSIFRILIYNYHELQMIIVKNEVER